MKKAIVFILALVFLLTNIIITGAEVLEVDEFVVTEDGEITAYYGEAFVSVPSRYNNIEIKKIGDKTFFDLGIESITIQDGIEEIGISAGEGCNVFSLYIPPSVRKIGDNAFRNCAELTSVNIEGDFLSVDFGNNVFGGTGYISFIIGCDIDRNKAREKLSKLKGDDNFEIYDGHIALVESMTEKDIFGENMIYCEHCGFKASKFLEADEMPFKDVSEDAWYCPYVSVAYSFGIINGKSEDVFDPDAGMTCAEAIKIAACINALSEGVVPEEGRTGEKWYDVYFDYCYEAGIIEPNMQFIPDKKITRAEMAYLFFRCNNYRFYINDVPLTDIPDVDEKTPYYTEILGLYNMGVAVGGGEYYFYPDAGVKRSEAATFIARILFDGLRVELPKG